MLQYDTNQQHPRKEILAVAIFRLDSKHHMSLNRHIVCCMS